MRVEIVPWTLDLISHETLYRCTKDPTIHETNESKRLRVTEALREICTGFLTFSGSRSLILFFTVACCSHSSFFVSGL